MSHDIFSAFSSEELKSAIGSKLFRDMFDTMPVAVAVLEAVRVNGKQIDMFVYTFANKTAERMASGPLTGNRIFLNDDALLFNNMSEVANTGKREDFLYHYQRDPEKWIHYSISRFDNGVILTYENVTERKKAAIALQRERSQMAEAQAICNAGSFEWDLIDEKVYWSDEMYRIHKLEPQSLVITPGTVFNYVHPEDQIRIRKKVERYTKMPGREELFYRLKLPNGEIRHMRTRLESFRGKSGNITHISGMAQDITDRKNTEEELRNISDLLKKQSAVKDKREAMLEDYGRIIGSVHDAIISIDTKGIIVTWNSGAVNLYGYSDKEAIGKHAANLIATQDKREKLNAILAKVFNGGESIVDFKTTNISKNQAEIDVVVNIVPLKDAAGKVTGAAATTKMASDSRSNQQSKQQLEAQTNEDKHSEALLKATLDSTLDTIQVFKAVRDESGNVIDFTWILTNKNWDERYGNVIGKSLLAQNPAVKTTGIFDRFVSVIATGIPQRHEQFYNFEQFDGWFDLAIVKLNDGVVMATRDVTESKITALQLTKQNKFVQSMTTATPDIMFVMEIDSKKIVFATKNVAETLGYTNGQIKKMKLPFLDIMHPEDRPAMIAHVEGMKTAEDGEVREIQYRLVDAKGLLSWFVDRNVVFKRDDNGVPTEKMGITHDINVRVNADEKIYMLNKSLKEKNRELRALNNELKTFTSVAAYDYKDTLQKLYTNLEFIISRDAKNLSNTGKANLRKAQNAIQKMKLLTDDIVDFSKIKTPDESPAQVDLNETVGTALDELADKIAVAMPDVNKEKLPVIKGYPFLLDLLFFHLLDNAIKFRKPDEKLQIRITYSLSKDKHTNHDVHAISIADNGIGLPQDEASKIFDMFYRIHDKKYKGSGIGLAICKKIADLHGGTMAIESEPGEGTTVCCFFPTV